MARTHLERPKDRAVAVTKLRLTFNSRDVSKASLHFEDNEDDEKKTVRGCNEASFNV